VAVLPRRSCVPAPVAVPPMVPAPPVAVLVATPVAVVLVGTPVVVVVPMPVVDVLVPPSVAAFVAAPVRVVPPVVVVVPVPAAPAAVPPMLLKNWTDGCRKAVVLRSGICARVKLGACNSRAWSTLITNVGGTAATATPGAVAATSLARTNVHGTGIMRPDVEATRAASAHPTGLITMFSIRPTGWPAMSVTLAPLATGTSTGEVVVVVVTVDCVAGTTGVNGACAKLAVAARAKPVAQSADLICVLFIPIPFSWSFLLRMHSFPLKSLVFKRGALNWVLTPKSSQTALNQMVFRGKLIHSRKWNRWKSAF
jgi:hypothetical protein